MIDCESGRAHASVPPMRRLLPIALLALAACASPDAPHTDAAQLRGAVPAAGASRGDVYVFLYDALDGPLPKGSGRPAQLSAIPEPRAFEGAPPDADYVFAQVPSGAYLLRALVDARGLFDPFIEVMAQPFAGDFEVGPASARLAGEDARVDLTGGTPTAWDPPIFTIDAPTAGAVKLTPSSTHFTIMHLKIDTLPFARADDAAFLYGAADADGDGAPDDFNGDGLADTYPEVLLRRLPAPDDGPEFSWPDGGPLDIVIPAATVQPDPLGRENEFVGTLQAVNGLYALIPPAAFVSLGPDATGHLRTRRLPSLPLGEYAVTVIQATGQFWQVPNGLSLGAPFAGQLGGPFPTQKANVRVVAEP